LLSPSTRHRPCALRCPSTTLFRSDRTCLRRNEMAVERAPAGSSLIDVLDRVLDKGIVIDAYVRVSLVGIDLVSVEARIVVASVEDRKSTRLYSSHVKNSYAVFCLK